MTDPSIEDMFDIHRFQEHQEFHKVLLYFPFGFFLLLFRLALGLLVWPLLLILPKLSKIRWLILRTFYPVLGIFIKFDGRNWNEAVKLLVSNHISILDHLLVDFILPCKLISNCMQSESWSIPPFWRNFEFSIHRSEDPNNFVNTLQKQVIESDVPVLVFPEGTTTNGRVGLLKFSTWTFAMDLPVQPVLIQVSGQSFISISPSVTGTSMWYDLLWLLFVPYTVFTLRCLPPMEKAEIEPAEEFSKRVQQTMAAALNIAPTIYTSMDKSEYEKQIHNTAVVSPQNTRVLQSTTPPSSETNRMARQIKEILPTVPLNVILQDLGVTKCMDATVSRILEGVVPFMPEPIPSSGSASLFASSSTESLLAGPSSSSTSYKPHSHYTSKSGAGMQNISPLSTAAKSFGKSSKERMMSYQERKTILLDGARMRYMQKHGMI